MTTSTRWRRSARRRWGGARRSGGETNGGGFAVWPPPTPTPDGWWPLTAPTPTLSSPAGRRSRRRRDQTPLPPAPFLARRSPPRYRRGSGQEKNRVGGTVPPNRGGLPPPHAP